MIGSWEPAWPAEPVPLRPDARVVLGLVEAWTVLREHPALVWTPPLWRHGDGGPVYRSIERNLLVEVTDVDGTPGVRLATGPLRDRVVGPTVDPVAPVAERDDRLDVRAPTFEDAVVGLAARVLAHYGLPGGPIGAGGTTVRPLAG